MGKQHAAGIKVITFFMPLICTLRIVKDNTSMVIISDDKETTAFLKLRASAIQTPLSDEDIYR